MRRKLTPALINSQRPCEAVTEAVSEEMARENDMHLLKLQLHHVFGTISDGHLTAQSVRLPLEVTDPRQFTFIFLPH